MRGVPESSNLQAIRCWLMARVPWPPDIGVDQERLREHLSREAERIQAFPPGKLIEEAEFEAQHDQQRSERLLDWSWRFDTIRLSDFGPWRTVGDGLPLEACRRSAVEAAAFIAQFPEALPGTQQPERQARYQDHSSRIHRLARYSDVLRSLPLLSVLVAEREPRGREDCEPLRFSCEDGSHRAIAMALAGHETVTAWVGHPRA
jgi:hypothetical protein